LTKLILRKNSTHLGFPVMYIRTKFGLRWPWTLPFYTNV